MFKKYAPIGLLVLFLVPAFLGSQTSYNPPGGSGGGGGGGMADPGGNGVVIRTAEDVTTNRSVTSSDGSITVTNGDGVSGNIDVVVDSSTRGEFTSSTSDASGNCSVGDYHLRTDTDEAWFCTSTNTWTQMQDNPVAVADLATGTDGNLITWDASGNPAVVATGTSGQVLTSNGAGAAPTFQAAGGGSGLGFAFYGSNAGGIVNASTTKYLNPGTSSTTAEVNAYWIVPAACTAKNFYVETGALQGANGSLVFTVRDDGADTSLVVTVPASSAAGSFSDTSNTASIAAGSQVSISAVNNHDANSASIRGWGFQCN